MSSAAPRKLSAKRRILAAIGHVETAPAVAAFSDAGRIEAGEPSTASLVISDDQDVLLDTVAYDPAMTVNDGQPTDDAFMHEWWVGRINTGLELVDAYARVDADGTAAPTVRATWMVDGLLRAAA